MTETETVENKAVTETISEKPTASKPESNIVFVKKVERKNAKTGEMETVDAEPPEAIHTVGASFKLPPAAEQLKGFYHEDAARIIREMPQSYKEMTKKGN